MNVIRNMCRNNSHSIKKISITSNIKIYLTTLRPSFILLQYSKFSTTNKNYHEIKEKLKKEGRVKLYDSKYTFNSEKLMVHGSLIFLIISSTTIIFSKVSFWLKLLNTFIVFVPSLLIQIEYLLNNTKFIKSIILLPDGKVQLVDMWNKKEIAEIKNFNKAADDPRLKSLYQSLNHQTFIIFTNKNDNAVYHVPRDGGYWDEGIFHEVIEGKTIDH